REVDRLANVMPPILGSPLARRHELTIRRGIERHRGRLGVEIRERGNELVMNRIHLRAMVSHLDAEEFLENAPGFERRRDLGELLAIPRKGDRLETIDGADR